MKIKRLLLSLMLLGCFGIQAQNVITVDNSVGANAQYDNISDAIAAAADGDIIYVHASENGYGTVIIDKPLSLIGYSHSDADKRTKINTVTINTGIDGVTIKGLHITGTGNYTVNISGSGSTPLENFVLENNKIDGHIGFQGAGANNLIIRGNTLRNIGFSSNSTSQFTNAIITNNIFNSIINVFYYNSVEIKNNIFLATRGVNNLNSEGDLVVQDCIFYRDDNTVPLADANSDGVIFENSLIYNANGTTVPLEGTNNINDQDPLFVSQSGIVFNPLNDYNLQAGSPAIGAGVSGNDIGLFTGVADDFMFNNFGFSQGIPTVAITAITNTVAPGGTVNVTIESNSN